MKFAQQRLRRLMLFVWIGFFLFGFLHASVVLGAGPIVVDHACTDITAIPQSAIEAAKTSLHIGYGHTSHGSQLTTGMNGLVDFANNGGQGLSLPVDTFSWNNGGVGGALDLEEGDGYGDGWLDHDAGYYPNWVDETRAYLDDPSHSDVNVIMWSWCGQASSYTEQQMVDQYLAPMSQLESEYPHVTFVYMTGHADGTGETGNLHLRNQQIRDYCIANNKVLYDFYDIECYDPDGNDYGDKRVDDACNYDSDGNGSRDRNWAIDWQNAHVEGLDWYSCSSAHSQPLNANQKAYAAWWMWARLAGWEQDGILTAGFSGVPTSGSAPLSVSFTDHSIGTIESWYWEFGDGGVSTEQHPTHIYLNPGVYSVTLTIQGPDGENTHSLADFVTVTDAQLQYALSLTTLGQGSVTIDPPKDYYDTGETVQLTPVPSSGWAFHHWSGDISGYCNPMNVVMNSNKTVNATFDIDNDADGICDFEENACPNEGDGNLDNIKDSDQQHVASFHSQDGSIYMTMESTPGTMLSDCRAVSPVDTENLPEGVTFPYDMFNFAITDIDIGGGAALILYFHATTNLDFNTYWKYGPTPEDNNPHWYEFMYESNTETGAEIDGNTITLHFRDGERGDDFLGQDGTIIDQGGPGIAQSNGIDENSANSGGGGGCFVSSAMFFR